MQDGQSFTGARASRQKSDGELRRIKPQPAGVTRAILDRARDFHESILSNFRCPKHAHSAAHVSTCYWLPVRCVRPASMPLRAVSQPAPNHLQGGRQTRRCGAPSVFSGSFMRGYGAVGPRKSRRYASSELSTQPRQSLSRSSRLLFPVDRRLEPMVERQYSYGTVVEEDALRVRLRKNPNVADRHATTSCCEQTC